MALVDGAFLPTRREDVDPRLFAFAAREGRVRGTALALIAQVLARPLSAEGVLRRGLREARYLHSRERRFVGDGVVGVLQHRRLLARAVGCAEDDAAALWLAWLVAVGLDPALAPTAAAAADLTTALPVAVAVAASVPDAVAQSLVDSVTDVSDFLAASNRRAPVVLRINRRRGDRDAVASALLAAGVVTSPTRLAADGLVVQGRPNLRGHRLAREGWFEVQDEASQVIAALVTGDGPVVDWCAGAGGKSLAIASALPGVPLLALDTRGDALERAVHRASRAGVTLQTAVHGRRAAAALVALGPPDVVLVDAPCSGTGVWRRHPGYRFSLAELPALVADQARILADAAAVVPVGGRLIYATCSVLRAENDDIVDAFVARDGAFAREERVRLTPHEHGTDGMGAVVLRRVAPTE